MSTDIEHVMSTITTVRHRFTGLNHAVPEWPGFSYTGKPAVITRVSVSHRVTEEGIEGPSVHIDAYPLKKDGTLMERPIDARFVLSSSIVRGVAADLRTELVEKYGADVAIEAQQVWQKLYG